MNEYFSQDVIELIAQANSNGIKFHYDNDELVIKIATGQKVDQAQIEQLREKKKDIMSYFRQLKELEDDQIESDVEALPILKSNGYDYYQISPIQNYWLNNDFDKQYKLNDPVHGIVILVYKIRGRFEPQIMQSTIASVINRHESLRARFSRIADQYMMRVEDANAVFYGVEIKDLSDLDLSEEEILKMVNFHGHRFSDESPLINSRIVKTGDGEYFFSLKLHHIICDTWSLEILLRDILITYRSLLLNQQASLPHLKYHYKEYLYFRNRNFKKNYFRDKEYWSNKYSKVPGKLNLPYRKRLHSDISIKLLKSSLFHYSKDLTDKISCFSRQNLVSLFEILQATIKGFLFWKTAQEDILIGTDILGREYSGMDNQIGCYAKAAVIRTVFTIGDTFNDIVLKVKKSNEDLKNYKAYSLADHLSELLPSVLTYGDFWTMNLYYNDENAAGFNEFLKTVSALDFSVEAMEKVKNALTPVDMQLRFIKTKTGINLEVGYDSSSYDEIGVMHFFGEYFDFCNHVLLYGGSTDSLMIPKY
jgi:Condensation domain